MGALVGGDGGFGGKSATSRSECRALMTESPTIISGPDLGFRVERTQNGMPLGKLVVRMNGKWIAPGSSATVVPAKR